MSTVHRSAWATEIEQAVAASGIPLEDWPGDCARISNALAEHYGGIARFGHFLGEISDDSLFAGRPTTQHGWIELPDGSVVDPTRWAFEHDRDDLQSAYIWHGPADEYDLGGDRLRRAVLEMQGIDPDEVPADDPAYPSTLSFSGDVSVVVERLIGPGPYTMPRVRHLAHIHPERFGDHAAAIYAALAKADEMAWVPIDFQHYVEGLD